MSDREYGEAATVVSLAEALDDPGDGPYTDEGRRRVASSGGTATWPEAREPDPGTCGNAGTGG